jgi:hypothetical protein
MNLFWGLKKENPEDGWGFQIKNTSLGLKVVCNGPCIPASEEIGSGTNLADNVSKKIVEFCFSKLFFTWLFQKNLTSIYIFRTVGHLD